MYDLLKFSRSALLKRLEEAERLAAEREKELAEVLHQKERELEAEGLKVRLFRRHERTPPDTDGYDPG
eukprot:4237258-Pyramimonas_sp.AAC.2